ncbi:MAG: DUF4097 domain-containing protein [Woeseia sp.]
MRILALTCLSLLSAAAAAESVARRLDAAADSFVSINNTAGSVEVTGWSRKEVEVSGELGSSVEELVFERDGKNIEITVRTPKRGGRNISSELVIHVPEKSSLEVGGVSADIDVTNVHGTLQLQSVSGDIDSEVNSADIEITTVSGDVEVQGDDKSGHAELSSVSGDIDAQNLAGEAVVNSVSGDLVLVNGSFERVRLETTNGDIVFKAKLSDDGTLNVETINGDLEIEFDGKVSARFDIETFNGDIRNCFGPQPVRASEYTPGRELKFIEGGGKGRVTVKTLNGDLNLCKD